MPFDKWQELPEVRYLAQIDAAERFLKDEDYKEAIAYYDIAIELKPDMVKAYRGRAGCQDGTLGIQRSSGRLDYCASP